MTFGPVGGVPLVTAVLSTEPWLTSSWVTVCDCGDRSGQSVVAPAARKATHGALVRPNIGSVMVTPVRSTLPVLVTWKV